MTAMEEETNGEATNTSVPELIVERVCLPQEPRWQKFQTTPQQNGSYQKQYSHSYALRLGALSKRSLDHARQQLNDTTIPVVSRILELKEGVPSLVAGTLLKERTPVVPSSNKVDMLEPWGYLEHVVSPLAVHNNNDNDNNKEYRVEAPCALEDESGRVELQGGALEEGRPYPTGVVVAVHGTVQPGTGIFKVHHIYAPTLSQPMITDPAEKPRVVHPDACVLLVSGLECANPSGEGSLARDLLLSYLTGHLDIETDTRASPHHVGRVIVAGGLLCPNVGSHIMDSDNASLKSPKEALLDLDAFLGQVGAAGIPVDVIPGKFDPTNANWPQRPLHKSLLPVSCGRGRGGTNVHCTPNPYEATLDDQSFLMVGNDGAALQDVRQVLGGNSSNNTQLNQEEQTATELEALQATFSFSHTCPTAPDSLGAMPQGTTDPHVLTERPHLYFAGNCTQFATDTVATNDTNKDNNTNMTTRLVCIPRFSQTGQAVLVHLQSLDCQVLEFKSNQED